MSAGGATCIGRVRHVLGATVTVELDEDLAGVSPIYRGHVHAVGQIGSLVRIPQGLVDLIGSVSLIGISELAGQVRPTDAVQRDQRWLQVQLIGELNRATSQFHRGIGAYPALDDEVHFATSADLLSIYPKANEAHIAVGALAAADDLDVCLNAARLVTRHAAVVGSTGSGKTSAVASILQAFANGGWEGANIVVIDPHGEYARALPDSSSVRSVLSVGNDAMHVPYWALPAADILRIFVGGAGGGATFINRFSELVVQARRRFAIDSQWLELDPNAITADTPIPFDLRAVWHAIDSENRETRAAKNDPASRCLVGAGNSEDLISATFEPYGPGAQGPHKADTFNLYGTTPDLLRLGLKDPRLKFFQSPRGTIEGPDPLINVVRQWLGTDKPVSVLNFSGVPPLAADLGIGVVLNLLFELCVRSEPEGPGIGRVKPVLVVLEEAHRYLGSSASALTRESANRIAREGRKYGIGLMLVTQRPTELPDTALSQCGTLIALRLTNSADQGAIKAALPDSVAGLASILPSLRTGEAVISGEALALPSRTLLRKPDPMPRAEDPSLESWRATKIPADITQPLNTWRGQYEEG